VENSCQKTPKKSVYISRRVAIYGTPSLQDYSSSKVESFFATVKKECLYLRKYATIDEVKKDIFEYVEMFYNRKRMHSYLGYMSPVEYRLAHSA
jgi:transposase InsO family protein